jgi:hypothetical protein
MFQTEILSSKLCSVKVTDNLISVLRVWFVLNKVYFTSFTLFLNEWLTQLPPMVLSAETKKNLQLLYVYLIWGIYPCYIVTGITDGYY